MPLLFLTPEELQTLTGYAVRIKQIAQLRKMGIPFRINGCGRAIVTRVAVEGGAEIAPPAAVWQPAVLQKSRMAA